ncbi:MAG TPA: 4,5-DOPA dioxygenase extradiol [Dehalococcoidales bacterium]|nr:4,5-DOPA dioxygenase extradiol [Dehalococcoidales bacterium]
MKMPVLFIGHGSPENIILKNSFTQRLVKLGQELPRPEAILVVSAHWLTDGTWVTGADMPKTIYDFYGFPDELYRQHYPSPGSTEIATFISELILKPSIKLDYSWGLDHAAWAILKHIYPKADIPVIEMSLDYSPYNGWNRLDLQSFYDLAKQLGPLRKKGILIIGSGNIVHNLRLVDMQNMEAKPYEWAVEFDEMVKHNLNEKNHKVLLDCQNLSRATALSIPTLEHYLPMIFAIGLQEKDDSLEFFYEGFQNRSVSMRCFKVG